MPAQPGSLGVNLPVGNVTETEVVTAAPLVVDVTSAVVTEAITLDLTSGRSYQSCPWLVPGVLSEDADAPSNPASKSGLNHRDIGGEAGVSRDNVYYIDSSINVTDGVSRTFGVQFQHRDQADTETGQPHSHDLGDEVRWLAMPPVGEMVDRVPRWRIPDLFGSLAVCSERRCSR